MEELKSNNKKKLANSTPLDISVFVYDEWYKTKEIKSITIEEFLIHFPHSKPCRILNTFNFPFITCFKAFLEDYFGGKVDPLLEVRKITGLSSKEVGHIEKLYSKLK